MGCGQSNNANHVVAVEDGNESYEIPATGLERRRSRSGHRGGGSNSRKGSKFNSVGAWSSEELLWGPQEEQRFHEQSDAKAHDEQGAPAQEFPAAKQHLIECIKRMALEKHGINGDINQFEPPRPRTLSPFEVSDIHDFIDDHLALYLREELRQQHQLQLQLSCNSASNLMMNTSKSVGAHSYIRTPAEISMSLVSAGRDSNEPAGVSEATVAASTDFVNNSSSMDPEDENADQKVNQQEEPESAIIGSHPGTSQTPCFSTTVLDTLTMLSALLHPTHREMCLDMPLGMFLLEKPPLLSKHSEEEKTKTKEGRRRAEGSKEDCSSNFDLKSCNSEEAGSGSHFDNSTSSIQLALPKHNTAMAEETATIRSMAMSIFVSDTSSLAQPMASRSNSTLPKKHSSNLDRSTLQTGQTLFAPPLSVLSPSVHNGSYSPHLQKLQPPLQQLQSSINVNEASMSLTTTEPSLPEVPQSQQERRRNQLVVASNLKHNTLRFEHINRLRIAENKKNLMMVQQQHREEQEEENTSDWERGMGSEASPVASLPASAAVTNPLNLRWILNNDLALLRMNHHKETPRTTPHTSSSTPTSALCLPGTPQKDGGGEPGEEERADPRRGIAPSGGMPPLGTPAAPPKLAQGQLGCDSEISNAIEQQQQQQQQPIQSPVDVGSPTMNVSISSHSTTNMQGLVQWNTVKGVGGETHHQRLDEGIETSGSSVSRASTAAMQNSQYYYSNNWYTAIQNQNQASLSWLFSPPLPPQPVGPSGFAAEPSNSTATKMFLSRRNEVAWHTEKILRRVYLSQH